MWLAPSSMMRTNWWTSVRSGPVLGVQQRRRRAFDGGQRHAQLVAHHVEKLEAEPIEFHERRQVLYRHHQGMDLALVATERRHVDQHLKGGPFGEGEFDLDVAERLVAGE